ncbi:MAG: aminotransferase class V-fold PLP-dependent enzyme [Candidatus Thermoplasmatota archaeon]|nr:aminotransferase class V-fold PLP-dependent enzyme [Candidatus Thermoplasmatota archaeon]
MPAYDLETIRKHIIGNNVIFPTPFGDRHLLYADYTASGRGVQFIEERMQNILAAYGNTHTEDDFSGKYLTTLLHQSEKRIKELVHAGEHGKVIMTGSGATGALKKLQEIIGVYIPPATKDYLYKTIQSSTSSSHQLIEHIEQNRPVVFIGPYEHHTNELMWRESHAEVVVIKLDEKGKIDLQDLEENLSNPAYAHRWKLASFSAGSNVTGIRTPVYDIACICHRHNTFVFFDFAAVAPYITIDMNRDPESSFDAIFFSPHKFLGGPGTCGVLVFNEKIYRKDLPPTTAGGGTVIYVGFKNHDFSEDIETREKAGTPPILQAIKAAMVLELKEKIGVETIEAVERSFTKYFIEKLKEVKNIELLGDVALDERVPIVSFNIRHKDRILHPRFVATLLNDLFGIQSRAGCSCAGPYGHILLGIDNETSEKYRKCIVHGCEGIKPGWVRVNIHYTLSQDDVDFILQAIEFIARSGHLFLQNYLFNMKTAEWNYIGFTQHTPRFSLDEAFRQHTVTLDSLPSLRASYLREAKTIEESLKRQIPPPYIKDDDALKDLTYFYCCHKTEG